MLPGNSQILTCPYCGTEKEIMSLMSGNTFGAELWSDNKQIAPMLPEISYVQKCPKCGKYYIRSRQETKYSSDGYSSEQGLLTFPEMKEAFVQLSQEGFLSDNEEINVRLMLHHAYNDYYYRTEGAKAINEEDKMLFHENGIWLIQNIITDNVLKIEFYRQIGELDKAYDLINTIQVEDDFLRNVVCSIRERLDNKDISVFKIQ